MQDDQPSQSGPLFPGHAVDPRRLYLFVSAALGFLQALAFTTYGLYVVDEVGLEPLELVLAGTALEGAVLISEVPTGVVADIYSRRLSVISGIVITGLGFLLIGLQASFLFVAAGQAVWGFGFTFISGAREAWLSDEVGEQAAAPVYLRATQVGLGGSLLGIPAGAGIAALDLQLPMIAAAAGFGALALLLLWTMTEAGYTPARGVDRSAGLIWRTFRDGLGTIRSRPTLIVILIVALLLGAASEAFDRLWPLHLLDNVGLSDGIDEVVWFGLIGAGSAVGGILLTGLAHRATDLDDPRKVVRTLLVLIGLLTIASFGFALADALWLAIPAIWLAIWVRRAIDPLTLVWINRGLEPGRRATVLSMLSQGDALGQIAGGPALGGIGSATSVRTSLLGVGVIVAPALLLYGRVWRRDEAAPPGGDTAGSETTK